MTSLAHRKRLRGFTLIEILAALTIFSVALVGFMQAMGESTRIQGDLFVRQRAMMLAENVLEEMRFGGAYALGEDDGDFKGTDAIYRWRTKVDENPDEPGLLDLAVSITWDDGRPRAVTLATQVAETEMKRNQ